MRRLVVLRHAKSAWPEGVPDYRRPLNDRGRRDAPAVGSWLAEHLDGIDLALVSPATRTRQTWELASAELPAVPPTTFDEQLYGEGADSILAVLTTLADSPKTVLLIGHNPDLEDVVETLTGTRPIFKTSSLALLTWHGKHLTTTPHSAILTHTETIRA
ncbi:histidine phosphatase family protein [Actinokineospora sp. NBRC 105648]|uniref:SixA phosphatase family protein n=1 Tax=Actinokineospora sp. NBRC 105648 TaxID=3032206 RepID=UPI0024A42ABF|nr:histidine phosphatase family protein [Actinokineospora sp. NBRC 105648]GLZ41619.1 phosphohistidine phosphatase [Actinokineospora sp. NBRC 105648]